MSTLAVPGDENDDDVVDSTAVEVGGSNQLNLWEEIAQRRDDAMHFTRSTLIKRDEGAGKYGLIGIPFVITKVTFQPRTQQEIDDQQYGYVSCEATIFPHDYVLRNCVRGFVPNVITVEAWTESYKLFPEEQIVINDGGTGIRRDLVRMFYDNGMIEMDLPTGTGRDFDAPWDTWKGFSQSTKRQVEDEIISIPEFSQSPSGGRLLITVERGLRASKDPAAPKGHSDTFYLS
jgi:hypothetical protein